MQRPPWATAVSIIGIVIAIYGLLNSGAGLMMPRMGAMLKQGKQMEQEHMEQEEQNIKASEAQEKKEAKQQDFTGKDFPESEAQKEFSAKARQDQEAFSQQADKSQEKAMQSRMQQQQGMFNMPGWYTDFFAPLASLISICIFAFYLFASILLLQTKPSSISFFSLAACATIGFTILKTLVAVIAMSSMGMAMEMTGIFIAVVSVVLLVVVAQGDKEAFTAA